MIHPSTPGTTLDGASRALRLVVLIAVAVGLGLRLAFRIGEAGEVDSIRFVLAINDFDPVAYRPHFPGYPVFVALGRLLLPLTGDATAALSLVCAISGGLLPIPVAFALHRLAGTRAAGIGALLIALNPLLWLYSEQLLSDMPGLLFLFASLALLVRALTDDPRGRWALAAALLLGLTLGVRLSLFPFVASAALLPAVQRRSLRVLVLPAAAFMVGCLAWLVPMVVSSGLEPLVQVGRIQTVGHFTRWGGSVVTEADLGQRVVALVWQVFAQGLGGAWWDRSPLALVTTAGLVALVVAGVRGRGLTIADSKSAAPPSPQQTPGVLPLADGGERAAPGGLLPAPRAARRDRSTTCRSISIFFGTTPRESSDRALRRRPLRTVTGSLALLVLPYLAWLLLGQNVLEKPRHALPLVVLLVAGLAVLASRIQRPAILAAALAVVVAGHAVTGLSLARAHRDTPSTQIQLARAVAELCGQGRPVMVYTASLQRHIERHAPCAEVVVVRRLSAARRDLARRKDNPIAAVASDVARVDRLKRPPYATFERDRYVQSARSTLALWLLSPVEAPRQNEDPPRPTGAAVTRR